MDRSAVRHEIDVSTHCQHASVNHRKQRSRAVLAAHRLRSATPRDSFIPMVALPVRKNDNRHVDGRRLRGFSVERVESWASSVQFITPKQNEDPKKADGHTRVTHVYRKDVHKSASPKRSGELSRCQFELASSFFAP